MNDCSVGLRLSSSFFAQQTVAPTPEESSAVVRSVLAYNSPQFRDYYPGFLFLNLAKQMRAWKDDNNVADPASLDANGYFTQIPAGATRVQSFWAWGGLQPEALGRYVMTFTGQGTVTISGTATLISTETTPEGQRIVFDVTSLGNIVFQITHIPDPADYPRAFVILRDDPDWIARYEAGEIFTPTYLDQLRPNGLPLAEYRLLNLMIVNNSTVIDWADYPGVDHAVYTTAVPIQILCALAKQAGHIPWFCIPAQASDAFVTQMATLVAQELPDILDQVRVEFTNEHWNATFKQNSMCLYKAAAEFGGVDRGACTLTEDSRDVILNDATGLNVGASICFFNPLTRRYSHNQVGAVNGTTVTLAWGHYQPTSAVNCVSADYFGASDWYAKRSCDVMTLWEAAAGVRPVRVLATQTANPTVSNNAIYTPEWKRVDPSAPDVASFHDKLAVTTYFYCARNTAERTVLLDLFRQGDDPANPDARDPITGAYLDDSAGHAWALQRTLHEAGTGLAKLDAWLHAQSEIADSTGLGLIVYEGLSDHTIAGLGSSADDTRLWQSYEALVFSEDFNGVWDRLFEMQRRYIEGPAMVYVEVAPASQHGLFGMRRYLGEVNPRATHFLNIANGLTRWSGDDVPPQTTDRFVPTIARTTNQRAGQNITGWFTKNAVAYSATNLPDGITLSADGVLAFAPTTDMDEVRVATVTVQTATGTGATFDVTFDLTYIPPIVLPTPSYETTFDDPDDPGIVLRHGAVIADGALICEDAVQQSHARLTAYDTLAAATDPDSVTFTLTYRLPAGFEMPGYSGVIAATLFLVLESRVRLSLASGSKTITPTVTPLTQNDGHFHRLTFVVNFVTKDCAVWQDGIQIVSLDAADFDPAEAILRLTSAQTRLGAPFSGAVQVRFGGFRAWFNKAFTPEEVAALDA